MPMLRRLTLLFAFTLIFPGSPALTHAQTSVSLAELQIAFWPEYDRQSMLVIYRGTLSPETSLPTPVEIDIPSRFGPPSAVAYGDPQGQLFDLEHTVAVSGDIMTISFEAPSAYFQFEYYDTSLDLSSATRRYSFGTTAPLPIQSLILQVQEPVGATGLSATPSVGNQQVGSDGLTYFEASLADLAAGDPITLDLTYSKPTDELSISVQNPVVTPELPTPSTGPQLDNATLTILAGVLGALLLGGGVVWLLRIRNAPAPDESEPEPRRRARSKGQPPKPKAVRPSASQAPAAPPDSPPASYCHECGAQSQPGDRFCRDCGTELRR